MSAALAPKIIRRHYAYLASFFLALHVALPIYIGSSFLGQFVSEQSIGWFYALASALSFVALWWAPILIQRLGLRRFSLIVIGLNALGLLGLVWFQWSAFLIGAFIWLQITVLLLRFNLDLYLETVTTNSHTGAVRGLFLTVANLAWVIAPWLAGSLAGQYGFRVVYWAALGALLPLGWITFARLEGDLATRRQRYQPLQTLARLWRARAGSALNLRRILVIDLVLNLFYAVMVIYSPLYLRALGLPWSTIGLLFSIMLLAFLLLEWPLGIVADRQTGEKEILLAGLAITGAFTLGLTWLNATTNLWLIGTLLFLTRVGAASVEIMKETYFFKQIGPGDSAALALSRDTQPLAYLLAPTLVSAFLFWFDLRYVFVPLGLLMLATMLYALRIRDTE